MNPEISIYNKNHQIIPGEKPKGIIVEDGKLYLFSATSKTVKIEIFDCKYDRKKVLVQKKQTKIAY